MGIFKKDQPAAPDRSAALHKFRLDLDAAIANAMNALPHAVVIDELERRAEAEAQRRAVNAPSCYVSAPATYVPFKEEPRAFSKLAALRPSASPKLPDLPAAPISQGFPILVVPG